VPVEIVPGGDVGLSNAAFERLDDCGLPAARKSASGVLEIEELFSVGPQFNRGFLRYVNSRKLRRLATAVGLGGLMAQLRKWQEDAWLGWNLMALERKRAT
jgi:hypothetical protein